jgi:hypothetical protein
MGGYLPFIQASFGSGFGRRSTKSTCEKYITFPALFRTSNESQLAHFQPVIAYAATHK